MQPNMTEVADTRTVFVVHGRNVAARDGVFEFLRSLGLRPLEWSQAVLLTGTGSPYIGDVLNHAFAAARAVVVLLTPDEISYLRRDYASDAYDPEHAPSPQARPNVLFEAGMAFGRHPDRTVLVEMGVIRPFSDVAGRHSVRLDNSPERRKDLAQRLETAGCAVDVSGSDWLKAGDLTPPEPPGGGHPLGRRFLAQSAASVRIDASYVSAERGGKLRITNYSRFPIHDLSFEIPTEAGPSFHVMTDNLPVKRLPPGKSVSFSASRSMGPGSDSFEIKISGRTPDGEPVEEYAFIDLAGG
jgi:predicted nucleotide-binding protein